MSTNTIISTPTRTKRHKRPSLSPRKPSEKRTRLSEPIPTPLIPPPNPAMEPSGSPPFTTTLNFYDAEKKKFKTITAADRKQLLRELRETFPGVLAITFSPPFLYVECNPTPDPVDTPFVIAGLVAKFLGEDEPYPWGTSFMGERGNARAPEIPAEVRMDLRPFHTPCIKTFEFLFDMIPQAEHITSYSQQLVVELKRSNDDDFIHLLNVLPSKVGGLLVGYIDGCEWFETQARLKIPDPQCYDGDYDDTNYLSNVNGGSLRPGALVECHGHIGPRGNLIGAMLCNAGVQVKRGNDIRFTTSMHCWDTESNKIVYHAGQEVGIINEKLGDDIALVNSQVPFSNEFLELEGKAKMLMKAEDIEWGSFFYIDSAFTGKQKLFFIGVRAGKRRGGKNWMGPKEEHEYVVVEQGVFSVHSPIIETSPMIRDGVCGSPLIYAGNVEDQEAEILEKGMVAGFMCYTDCIIPTLPKLRMIYCYCQTADELIDAGWSISGDEETQEEIQ